MKKGLIDLVFILDKSGSMHDMVSDAVGGYNSLLLENKKKDQEIYVTTILFNTTTEILYFRRNIKEIEEMQKKDYIAGGCTALYDAIGSTIDALDDCYQDLDGQEPERTLFYITTDGMENSSREYTNQMIHRQIKLHEKTNWRFAFLASGIDEREVGDSIGISKERCYKVPEGKKGQHLLYENLCCIIDADMK